MGFFFDVLIPALIIIAVALVWFGTLFSRFLPRGLPRKVVPPGPWTRNAPGQGTNPRSFSESGGADYPAPARPAAAERSLPASYVESTVGIEDLERRPVRSQPGTPSVAPPSPGASRAANRIRLALRDRDSVRTAVMVKEVLDPPVGMR